MKSYPLEKFGIYSVVGGLDEAKDAQKIQALQYNLSRKALQFRRVKKDLLIYVAGVELARLQMTVNGEENDRLLSYFQRAIRLQVRSGKLYLMCYNEPLVRLAIEANQKLRKFYVALEEV